MSPEIRGKLLAEADLISRFAESYRRKFSCMIDQMNHKRDASLDLASLRLCVEAVDMMLSTQKQLAKAMYEMSGGTIKIAA